MGSGGEISHRHDNVKVAASVTATSLNFVLADGEERGGGKDAESVGIMVLGKGAHTVLQDGQMMVSLSSPPCRTELKLVNSASKKASALPS